MYSITGENKIKSSLNNPCSL